MTPEPARTDHDGLIGPSKGFHLSGLPSLASLQMAAFALLLFAFIGLIKTTLQLLYHPPS